ncbi:MAG: hypothetical protein ACP5N2_01135 [Candidatus Nanoarchaeia archaeon]
MKTLRNIVIASATSLLISGGIGYNSVKNNENLSVPVCITTPEVDKIEYAQEKLREELIFLGEKQKEVVSTLTKIPKKDSVKVIQYSSRLVDINEDIRGLEERKDSLEERLNLLKKQEDVKVYFAEKQEYRNKVGNNNFYIVGSALVAGQSLFLFLLSSISYLHGASVYRQIRKNEEKRELQNKTL